MVNNPFDDPVVIYTLVFCVATLVFCVAVVCGVGLGGLSVLLLESIWKRIKEGKGNERY
jgi:hypothetical protein